MEISYINTFILSTGVAILLYLFFDVYKTEIRSPRKAIFGTIGLLLAIMAAYYCFVVEPVTSVLGSGAPSLFNYIFVFITSCLPVVAYWKYIRHVDSAKAEPLHVLILAAALGVVAAFVINLLGKPLFVGGIKSELTYSFSESVNIGFLDLAVPAELAKWLLLLLFLRWNRYYDEYIDGVVYSVSLSLGFTVILSTWFILGFIDCSGWLFLKKGFVTAFLLIPIHFMSGVLMGYFIAIVRKRNKVLNSLFALIAAILLDGTACTMITMIGGRFILNVLVVICLSILACMLYNRIYYLLQLDGVVK